MLIDLHTDTDVVGRAYLMAFRKDMLKPLIGCVEALAGLIRDDPLAPLEIHAKLNQSLTLLGTPGLVGLALSGIDMAAWDAYAQSLGVPLVEALGGKPQPVRAYNSCGLWIQEPEKLADEAERLLAEGAFNAVKLRLGREDFHRDLEAVRNVRQRIGDDVSLMVDFNQSLTVAEAIRRGRALDDEGLYWIEEPVRHNDYAGCARIRQAINTPLQTGENLLSPQEMQTAITAGAASYYMPDVQRIGGVSGWLHAASLAHAFGLEMSSHLFPEYSSHLLAVTPTRHWLEYVDWAAAVLRQPARVEDGQVIIPDRPGSGIVWDEAAVSRYLL